MTCVAQLQLNITDPDKLAQLAQAMVDFAEEQGWDLVYPIPVRYESDVPCAILEELEAPTV